MSDISVSITQPNVLASISSANVSANVLSPNVSASLTSSDIAVDVVSAVVSVDIMGGAMPHIIQYEGNNVTSRKYLNFEGSAVVISDDIVNNATTVTISVDGSIVQYPAGENLSAGRVVVIDGGEAFYFQPSITSHGGRAFGVTASSASTGDNVSVQVVGEAVDASFSAFADVPIYVGDDGELQTTFPPSGLIQKAGFGTGTNKIMIDFSTQILQ